MKKSLILLSLACTCFSTLTVYSPAELKSQFSVNGIEYSVANFGHIPYGKRLVGPVIMANPIDGCQPINITDKVIGPFVIINRGQCSFVTQVQYAQLAGARLAIIADNVVQASQNITMGDDGLGDSVNIPSIFISVQSGEKIEKAIAGFSQDQFAMFVVDFLLPKVGVVEYSFFLNIPSPTGEYLIHDFKKYREKLDPTKFLFTPHYMFFENPSYEKKQNQNCLGSGKYCCFDPDGPGKANGKVVAQEQLRQICVFQTYKEAIWWEYLEKYHIECPKAQSYDICSEKIAKDLKLDWNKIMECYRGSFDTGSILALEERNNKLLDKQLNATINSGIIEWPGVSINKNGYRGTLNGFDVLEAICASTDQKPQVCVDNFPEFANYDYGNNTDGSGPSITGIVVTVVVLLVLFFLFLVFIYRRMIKKELQREMEEKVPSIVTNYIAFHEANKGKQDSNL